MLQYVNSCWSKANQILLFWNFLELKNIYIFNPRLVESTDVEPEDTEGQLDCSHRTPETATHHTGTRAQRKHAYLIWNVNYFHFWTYSTLCCKVQGLSLSAPGVFSSWDWIHAHRWCWLWIDGWPACGCSLGCVDPAATSAGGKQTRECCPPAGSVGMVTYHFLFLDSLNMWIGKWKAMESTSNRRRKLISPAGISTMC